MARRVILASSSPRRYELLKKITDNFEVIVSGCDENLDDNLKPEKVVMTLSERKARAVAEEVKEDDYLIIASDTVVALNGSILGKPADESEAFSMLKSLSGNTHQVFSGVCILTKEDCIVLYEKTSVSFAEMSDEEIKEYIISGEPMDKAGAYGIQGLAGKFITAINGDYYNVVGLPLASLYAQLKKLL